MTSLLGWRIRDKGLCAMTGQATLLFQYMDGANKRFVIPVYQRNYDWRVKQCRQLFDDLCRVIRENRASHFFGSIVAQHSGVDDLVLIDGQQRLTTITLMLLAMQNLLKAEKAQSKDHYMVARIGDFLTLRYASDDQQKIRLKLFRNDAAALKSLFDPSLSPIEDSNITRNYHYFEKNIEDGIRRHVFSIDDFYQAMRKLQIIAIMVEGGDDAQLIFESLNATGLSLSEGDKVRNYVLMHLPSERQEYYYVNRWNKIENLVGDQMDLFLRDYLGIKRSRIPAFGNIYLDFKDYATRASRSLEECLDDLLTYAKRYHILLGGEEMGAYSAKLKACIERLNRLDKNVVRPFLMEVLRLKEDDGLSLEEVEQIFFYTESFVVRRLICDVQTSALSSIFSALHGEIMRLNDGMASYFERFKYAITSKNKSGRFPDDNEFLQQLGSREIYQMATKNIGYLLERFENRDSTEDHDVYRHLDSDEDDKWSIEHVMPQKLTPDWERDLGSDAQTIHETWCHRLANLTLTAYNSKYSNSSFNWKKTCGKGYLESGIRLNQYIARFETWDLMALEERNRELKSQALNLWPRPVTIFKPAVKTYEMCTLEEIKDSLDVFTGRKPRTISYKGREFRTSQWRIAYTWVLKLLYEENPASIEVLRDHGLAFRTSVAQIDLPRYEKIAEKVYAFISTGTKTKLGTLKTIFEDNALDASLLSFTLEP